MSKSCNVFISWSEERSRVIAAALRSWLPTVLQSVKPWMSDNDIEKGSRGAMEMSKALESISVGITCLTPENLTAPWIHYEAGALSKSISDQARLCTYLLGGLTPQDVKPPLSMFQHTRATKGDTRKMLDTINVAISDEPVSSVALDKIFDAMWPQLNSAIAELAPAPPTAVPKRTTEDMLEEILSILRAGEKDRTLLRPVGFFTAGADAGVRLTAAHQRSVKGFNIEVSAQGEMIANVTTTFDGIVLASDIPAASSYSRSFSQVGGWTPGANHSTTVVALDGNGRQHRAVDSWID